MIEKVYSGKDADGLGEVKIPKNIRQVGNNQSKNKVYIEDYVMNQIKKKPEDESNVKYGVLLGEVKKSKGNTYFFVKAMVEVREIIENSIIFNDEIWSDIYKNIKKYFENLDIVGWFASVPYQVNDGMNGLKKIHLDNFAGNNKVCFLSERTEKEEGFYIFDKNKLCKLNGFYIYYERNDKMKKYIKSISSEETKKEKQISENDIGSKQIINRRDDKPTIVTAQTNSGTKSLREMLKEKTEGEPNKKQGKVAYGISGLLIVALLLSTVVMLNNYGELKNIKNTLSDINSNNEVRAVNEILSAYTVEDETSSTENSSKKAESTQNKQEESMEYFTEKSTTAETQKQTEALTKKYVSTALAGQHHKVKSGQTLYDISMKYYGTSEMVDAIKAQNNIGDDNKIVEGQDLVLP